MYFYMYGYCWSPWGRTAELAVGYQGVHRSGDTRTIREQLGRGSIKCAFMILSTYAPTKYVLSRGVLFKKGTTVLSKSYHVITNDSMLSSKFNTDGRIFFIAKEHAYTS